MRLLWMSKKTDITMILDRQSTLFNKTQKFSVYVWRLRHFQQVLLLICTTVNLSCMFLSLLKLGSPCFCKIFFKHPLSITTFFSVFYCIFLSPNFPPLFSFFSCVRGGWGIEKYECMPFHQIKCWVIMRPMSLLACVGQNTFFFLPDRLIDEC